MTDHPLTDELCFRIVSSTPPLPRDQQDRVLSYDGRILDGMYEKWYESQKHEMRAAANWQLEQVIKWIEDEGFNVSSVSYEHLKYDDDHGFQEYVSDFTANLREAMRPQKEQLQQEGNS